MNPMFKKAGLAVVLGVTALTATAPAEAQRYRGGWDRHRGDGGTAVVAGIAGLAIGAAIASGANDRYRDRYYYDRGYPAYYDNRYYRDRGYYPGDGYYAHRYRDRHCGTRWVWDPYARRDVRVRYC